MSALRTRLSEFRAGLEPTGPLPLALLTALSVVGSSQAIAFGTLAPDIRRTFGVSRGSFILIVTLYASLSLMLTVPFGYLADRMQRVRLVPITAITAAVAAFFTGLAPVLWVLVLVRIVGVTGGAIVGPVHPSLVSDYYRAGRLPATFSVLQAGSLVALLAGPLAGLLENAFGSWRPVFFVFAVPNLLMAVLVLRLKEPERGALLGVDVVDERIPFMEAFRRLRAIDSLRRIWGAAILFGSSFAAGSFQIFVFDDVYGVGSVGRGLLNLLFGVGGALGLAAGALLGHRMLAKDRPDLLALATGLFIVEAGLGTLGVALAPRVEVAAVMGFLGAVGASGFLPTYLTAVSLITSPWLRTQAYAYSILFFAVGAVGMSRIAGAFGDDHGIRAGLGLLATFIIGGGLVGISVRRFMRRDVEQVAK